MRILAAALTFASLVFWPSVSAKEANQEYDIQERLLDEAFDPAKLFRGREPKLTIRYTGDDRNFPVYAIAVFEGCHADDENVDSNCARRLQARMIRAPYNGKPKRPRYRGMALVQKLKEARIRNDDQLFDHLDAGSVEWLETDLKNCPAASEIASKSSDIPWFTKPIIRQKNDRRAIYLHADKVTVNFRPNYLQEFGYSGVVKEQLPSEWAVQFAISLEDCWKPSSATPPWRRKPLLDPDFEEEVEEADIETDD